ncbi:hypothetical protein [Pseudomonas sp. NFACC23-1]|uniref:hypothetical protein n=1 Tax=unclassified Pseudomonas TaxID=196821 RepID=UPI000AF2B5B2
MRVPISDEVNRPQNETDNAGQGLLERAFARENLKRAWKRVKANKGAAGVDGLDIEQTAKHLLSRWPTICEQLLSGVYRPSPVKRVVIPKPDGGERELGIFFKSTFCAPGVERKRTNQAAVATWGLEGGTRF